MIVRDLHAHLFYQKRRLISLFLWLIFNVSFYIIDKHWMYKILRILLDVIVRKFIFSLISYELCGKKNIDKFLLHNNTLKRVRTKV